MQRKRNEVGHFKELPDSLSSKTIGVRLPKERLSEFEELCDRLELSKAEVVRLAVLEFMDRNAS